MGNLHWVDPAPTSIAQHLGLFQKRLQAVLSDYKHRELPAVSQDRPVRESTETSRILARLSDVVIFCVQHSRYSLDRESALHSI
jgi:hypothetical protein